MSYKTPAEQQLEFLKKLKEQQKDGVKRPAPAPRPAESKPEVVSGLRKSKASRKRKGGRGIAMSEEAWQRFKAEGLESGRYLKGKALGDWVVRLLLNLPTDLKDAPEDIQRELFEKVREWSSNRGIK